MAPFWLHFFRVASTLLLSWSIDSFSTTVFSWTSPAAFMKPAFSRTHLAKHLVLSSVPEKSPLRSLTADSGATPVLLTHSAPYASAFFCCSMVRDWGGGGISLGKLKPGNHSFQKCLISKLKFKLTQAPAARAITAIATKVFMLIGLLLEGLESGSLEAASNAAALH